MSCEPWFVDGNSTDGIPFYDTDPLPFDGMLSLTPKYLGDIG